MAVKHKIICRLIILIGFLPLSIIGSAQKKPGLEPELGLEVDKWADKLSTGKLNEVNSLGRLTNLLMEADTLRAFRFLDSVERSNKAKGYYFRTYFSMVKADYLFAKFAGYDKYKDRGSKELQRIKDQLMKLQADALDAVYHTEDDLQTGWVSFYSARRMRSFGEIGWAVMYSKNGVDLFEKVAYPVEPPVYTELAELLHQVKEYDESIIQARKALSAWKQLNYENDIPNPYKYKVRALNTIGITFYKRNQHDSATAYCRQALQLAKENNDTLLTGMVMGSIGRILYAQNNFDSSYFLLKTDYQNNKAAGNYDKAADASEWAAKANLARGNKLAALAEAREAIQLLVLWPNGPYLRDTYHTLTQIFRAMGNYDSSFYYNDRYTALNDSLEKEVATSSLAIAKTKLNNEVSRFNIQKLSKEKRLALQLRNFVIILIVLISIIALLYVNRLRIRHIHKEQLALQEKKATETSARKQLESLTHSLIEKAALVDELQLQLNKRNASEEKQELASAIANLTIIKEDDWQKFKSLFEQLYPGFFMNLQEKVNDITLAELRMAALTRLRLSANQIASILGISANSVYKTKQRLRQRLNIDPEIDIEDAIAKM